PVQSPADLKAFIRLPYLRYRDDPTWVPPLRDEMRKQFDSKRNPFLDHCEYALFLLRDGTRVIGRIAAFIDTLAIQAWNERVGLFGYYECPPDPVAARLLLETASAWLKTRGMTAMRGPWSFVSQEWGAVVEGYQPSPVVMAPYNPAYFNEQFTAFGFEKIKDLLVYVIDARDGYRIPERILTLTDRVAARYAVHVRPIDMKHLARDVETFIDLSNQSLENNWGYAPVTEAEVRAMVSDLKPIIHPKAVLFAEDSHGKPIGFAVAIPDVNIILKKIHGRLLPFGWLSLLRDLPRLTHYRMFALGVIPEYHGKGIDSLLYRALYESCFSADMRMEINYVLEDNAPMNNAILKLGAKPLRRYRIYQCSL
ncbi:MAG: GNAT family N-acetyltransferase, partial [Anaerolineaceae bacterium]|nr:GNAT family N-acetyltransferase [Anaerolineaceae bacterium]